MKYVLSVFLFFLSFDSGMAEVVSVRNDASPRLILFIHGLTGSVDETFKNGRGEHWYEMLRDKDPSFSSSDIAVFGFFSSYLEEGLTMEQIVTQMREELEEEISLSQYQNITIVAHSLGGIVAREFALSNEGIAKNIDGLILFGTPMNGSILADLLRHFGESHVVRDLARSIGDDPDNYLQNLRKRWRNTDYTKSIAGYCGFETQKQQVDTGWISIPTIKVVQRNSAEYLCSNGFQAIHSDHSNLIKPDNVVSDERHTHLRDWFFEIYPDVQQANAFNQSEDDVVHVVCTNDRYEGPNDALTNFLSDNVFKGGYAWRVSEKLPINWPFDEGGNGGYLKLLWSDPALKPAVVSIHYSCFETDETMVGLNENRADFLRFYRSLRAENVDVLVFSRGLLDKGNIPFHRELLAEAGYEESEDWDACLLATAIKNIDAPNANFSKRYLAALDALLTGQPCPAI